MPLFLEELTKAVVEAGPGEDEETIAAIPSASAAIPATLQASLVARLDRLGLAKEIAQIGAVIGREFSYELLRALTALSETRLDAALDQLVASELVSRRGAPPAASYVFKHALVQEAAHETLLRAERRRLHARIADLLEQRAEVVERKPELLAQHYAEAGINDKAVNYWRRAGSQSLAKSAPKEAVSQLQRGLDQLLRLPDSRERAQQELEILIVLATALRAAKGYADPAIVAVLQRARRLVAETGATGTELHFSLLYGQLSVYYVGGKSKLAVAAARELLSLAEMQTELEPLITGHRNVGTCLISVGDYASALQHLETAVRLYQFEENRESALRYGQDNGVASLCYLSWVLWHLGYPDRATEAISRARAVGRKLGHEHTLAYAFFHFAVAAFFRRDPKLVEEYAHNSTEVADRHGFPVWLAFGDILLGWVGARNGGAEQIRRGMAAARATGSGFAEPLFLGMLAEALALAGRAAEGLAAITEGLAVSTAFGQAFADADLHRLRGDLLQCMPNPDLPMVENCYREALAIAQRQGSRGFELRASMSLARLWAEAGRRDEARNLLAPFYSWFTEGFDTPDLKEAKALLDELA